MGAPGPSHSGTGACQSSPIQDDCLPERSEGSAVVLAVAVRKLTTTLGCPTWAPSGQRVFVLALRVGYRIPRLPLGRVILSERGPKRFSVWGW